MGARPWRVGFGGRVASASRGFTISRREIEEVARNDKQRFIFGESRARIRTRDKRDEPFLVNSRVVHREWGEGLIQRYEGDKMIVLFDEAGYKTLGVDGVLEVSFTYGTRRIYRIKVEAAWMARRC